jgi:hypothetical protein
MSKVKQRDPQDEPELMSLAKACRRAGLSVQTASRLPPDQFVPWSWLGKRRVVSRRRFEAWLAEKIGMPPTT